jgi:hypothetical protein
MDWTLAISRNRDALLRMLAALFAMAGFTDGKAPDILPRHIYRKLLGFLRPAESAVRRLIIIAAHELIVKFAHCSLHSSHAVAGRAQWWGALDKLPPKLAHFQLFDPLKRFANPAYNPITGAPPRISVPGVFDPIFSVPVTKTPDDLIPAMHLGKRLEALKRALENLPSQALRLARWRARRDMAHRQNTLLKVRRLSPLRPGSPPGARRRLALEVDGILRECHALALDRLAEPNTS